MKNTNIIIHARKPKKICLACKNKKKIKYHKSGRKSILSITRLKPRGNAKAKVKPKLQLKLKKKT